MEKNNGWIVHCFCYLFALLITLFHFHLDFEIPWLRKGNSWQKWKGKQKLVFLLSFQESRTGPKAAWKTNFFRHSLTLSLVRPNQQGCGIKWCLCQGRKSMHNYRGSQAVCRLEKGPWVLGVMSQDELRGNDKTTREIWYSRPLKTCHFPCWDLGKGLADCPSCDTGILQQLWNSRGITVYSPMQGCRSGWGRK